MMNVLQEFCPAASPAMRVDRATSTIRGVKVLGVTSVKGREYPRDVIARAVPLYENRVVNVDHVDPGTRRSYRDRIGCLKDVRLCEGGLFANLHFNPRHVLAEQLIWDAENAPQNVGFSHDARGPSVRRNGREVVESIDKVLSVDLVANPATTGGLFESRDGAATAGARVRQEGDLTILPDGTRFNTRAGEEAARQTPAPTSNSAVEFARRLSPGGHRQPAGVPKLATAQTLQAGRESRAAAAVDFRARLLRDDAPALPGAALQEDVRRSTPCPKVAPLAPRMLPEEFCRSIVGYRF